MKIYLLATLASVILISCSTSPTDTGQETPTTEDKGSNAVDSVHTLLGTPVDATPGNDNVFQREQYVFSYDPDRNTTNWVAWELSADWYGDEPRYDGDFKTDPLLPEGWYKVKYSDYTNSGYDRGHLVRSEERTIDEDDNISTFYTTNLLPMLPEINRWGPWLELEYHFETLLKDNPTYTAWIYAGGIFSTDSTLKGLGVVPVPDTLWKAAVIKTGSSINSENVMTIAVKIPNDASYKEYDWEALSVTIDDIEASTGYDLFYSIHDSIEEQLESELTF